MVVNKDTLNGYFSCLFSIQNYISSLKQQIDDSQPEFTYDPEVLYVYDAEIALLDGIMNHLKEVEANYKKLFIKDE